MRFTLPLLALALFSTGCSTMSEPKQTFVIVHGAWGGGWSWKTVDQYLTADGNKVYRPTLTGLGEREHLFNPSVGLDTHVQDIVNVIKYEDLHNIILVGHSYGGMVITGVAQQVPDRISKIIYLDAFLPRDGESVDDLAPKNTTTMPLYTIKDGLAIPSWKMPDQPPGDVPHPAKTLSDKLTVNNPAAAKIPGAYILFVPAGTEIEKARFYKFYERAQEMGYTMRTLDSDHNAWRSHPKELADLLENIVKSGK